MESRIVLKTCQQKKLYPPTDISVSQQCRPQLLSVKFENLVHSIFRNENSSLEINVSHFRVLHWQHWQHPASAPVNVNSKCIYSIWVRLKSRREELKQQVKVKLVKFVGMFCYDCSYDIRFIFTNTKPCIFRIKIFKHSIEVLRF